MISNALLLVSTISSVGVDNGQSITPPMGFNDWNELAAHYPKWKNGLNESDVLGIANVMVSSGLKDKGYRYVNLDCGYSTGGSNSHKPLAVDSEKFPSGLKALGQKLHSMGLLFGIYSSGEQCCDKNIRLGMEKEDAAQFAAWGVDYVKYDDCGTTTESFKKMRDALNATGRPMVYSIHSPWTHHPDSGTMFGPDPETSGSIANAWRTTNDITNNFSATMNRATTNDGFAKYAGPHGWNDPDMLEVGNAQISDAEGQSHFALWCLMKAPLLMGTDLTAASAATLATLGNEGAIAINQDPLGVQGTLRRQDPEGAFALWAGPLSHGCTAALAINLGDAATLSVTATFAELGINAAGAQASVVDVWTNKTVAGTASGSVTFKIFVSHGNAFYRLCPI